MSTPAGLQRDTRHLPSIVKAIADAWGSLRIPAQICAPYTLGYRDYDPDRHGPC